MKHVNKILIMVIFSFSPVLLQAITILSEDLWNIEYSIDSDDSCVVNSISVINKDLKNRIEIIVRKIEASKNLNKDHAEIVSLSLLTQLSVELDVLKATLIENLEDRKKLIAMYQEEIYKSSDAEQIKSCLISIDIEKKVVIKLIHNCFDWIEKIKEHYCEIFSHIENL